MKIYELGSMILVIFTIVGIIAAYSISKDDPSLDLRTYERASK